MLHLILSVIHRIWSLARDIGKSRQLFIREVLDGASAPAAFRKHMKRCRDLGRGDDVSLAMDRLEATLGKWGIEGKLTHLESFPSPVDPVVEALTDLERQLEYLTAMVGITWAAVWRPEFRVILQKAMEEISTMGPRMALDRLVRRSRAYGDWAAWAAEEPEKAAQAIAGYADPFQPTYPGHTRCPHCGDYYAYGPGDERCKCGAPEAPHPTWPEEFWLQRLKAAQAAGDKAAEQHAREVLNDLERDAKDLFWS